MEYTKYVNHGTYLSRICYTRLLVYLFRLEETLALTKQRQDAINDSKKKNSNVKTEGFLKGGGKGNYPLRWEYLCSNPSLVDHQADETAWNSSLESISDKLIRGLAADGNEASLLLMFLP